MAENAFSGFAEGMQDGANWAAKQTELDLTRRRVDQQDKEHQLQVKKFDADVGSQTVDMMFKIRDEPDPEQRKSLIDAFKVRNQNADIQMDDTWYSALKSQGMTPNWARLKQSTTGLMVANPEAYNAAMSDYRQTFGNQATSRFMDQQVSDAMKAIDATKKANAEAKAKANKPSAFQQAAEKEAGTTYAKEVEGIKSSDVVIDKIDHAMSAAEEYQKNNPNGTGPIATVFGLKAYVHEPTQNLNAIFQDLAIKNMADTFQGMSRSIDTGVERAAFDATQANIKNDDKVNAGILLGAKSLAMKKKADAQAKQAYVNQNGNADGYVSPILGKQTTLIDPQGTMKLVPKQAIAGLKDSGWKTLDQTASEFGGKKVVTKPAKAPPKKPDPKAVQSEVMQILKDAGSPEERERILDQLRKEFPDPAQRKALGIP